MVWFGFLRGGGLQDEGWGVGEWVLGAGHGVDGELLNRYLHSIEVLVGMWVV